MDPLREAPVERGSRAGFKSAADYLSEYAAYHRDRRNIAIHSVGIPLIVFAVAILASRTVIHAGALFVWPAAIMLALLDVFYLRLDRTLGLAFAFVAVVFGYAAMLVAAQPLGIWLAAGVGIFVIGWILQFIGHGWEGKKPAFLDDLMGLAIGPLFVTAEAFFAAGQLRALHDEIERRVGPTYVRSATAKA